MKNIILLILSTFLFIGCGNNKNVDPALAGTITDPPKVESDPVTVQLKITNNTEDILRVNCTWCVDAKDQWDTIPVGQTYTVKSNTHDAAGTVFAAYPKPPVKDVPEGGWVPADGNFMMTYGYWSNTAHITCNWDCNHSSPTEKYHYTGGNWVYDMAWENEGDVMNGHVTFTVKPAGPFDVTTVPEKE